MPDRPLSIPIPSGRQLKTPTHKSLSAYLEALSLPPDSHAFLRRFAELVSTADIEASLPLTLNTTHDKETYLYHVLRILPHLVAEKTYQRWLNLEQAEAMQGTQLGLYRLLTCTLQLYNKAQKEAQSRTMKEIAALASNTGRTRMQAAVQHFLSERQKSKADELVAAAAQGMNLAESASVKELREQVNRLQLHSENLATKVTQVEGNHHAEVGELRRNAELQATSLATFDQRITQNATTLANLDHRITENSTTLSTFDHRITENSTTLTNFDHRITDNSTTLANLDLRITDNSSAISTAITTLDSYTTKLESLDQRTTENSTTLATAVRALSSMQSQLVSTVVPKRLGMFIRVLPIGHSLYNDFEMTPAGLALSKSDLIPIQKSSILNGEATAIATEIVAPFNFGFRLLDPGYKTLIVFSGYSGTGKSKLMGAVASNLLNTIGGLTITSAHQVSGNTRSDLLPQAKLGAAAGNSQLDILHSIMALRETAATAANAESSRASLVLKLSLSGQIVLLDLCGDEHAEQRLQVRNEQDLTGRRTTGHIINDNLEVKACLEEFVRSGVVKQSGGGGKIIGLVGKGRLERVCVVGCVNAEDDRGMAITLGWLRRLCA